VDDCSNFRGVLEDLLNHLELAVANKRGLAILPIMLTGGPGVGKTYFAKQLAKALGLDFQFVSSTMSAGWVLGGSAPNWQGARHGKISASLIAGEFGNPVYLLDELDKTGGDSRREPFGALLQPHSVSMTISFQLKGDPVCATASGRCPTLLGHTSSLSGRPLQKA
jgi:ATP-dependent Lon protease